MVVDNNLLAGGGYTLVLPRRRHGGFTWTNNRFSRIFVTTVGGFGPVYRTCAQHTNSGNVYHETGKPLKLRIASDGNRHRSERIGTPGAPGGSRSTTAFTTNVTVASDRLIVFRVGWWSSRRRA